MVYAKQLPRREAFSPRPGGSADHRQRCCARLEQLVKKLKGYNYAKQR